MRVSIDRQVCTGHGRCYAYAPELFEPDDEGRGMVRCTEVPDALRGQALLAISNCPEEAISVEESVPAEDPS